MDKLARFMIRNRWWVIVGWIVFLLLANGISRGLGGANYKDEFKLPHTETHTVADLLKNVGQATPNGIDGLMVLQTSSGTLAQPPAGVVDALVAECKAGNKVVS